MDQTVSIIVPIYKVEAFLPRCIESLMGQTYQNIEIILVDDGSPDGCGAICDAYAARDERIKVVHKENGGLSDARNAGMEAAAGEFYMFIDSDDYVAENMVEAVLVRQAETDADMVVFNHDCVDEGGTVTGELSRVPDIRDAMTPAEGVRRLYNTDTWYFVMAWNKLYRRCLFDEIRFPKGKLHEDEFTTYKLMFACKKIAYTPAVLYHYTIRAGSIMNTSYSGRNLDKIEAYLERTTFFKERGEPALAALAAVRTVTFLHEAWCRLDRRVPEDRERYRALRAQAKALKKTIPAQHFGKKDKMKLFLFYFHERAYDIAQKLS